MPSAGPSDTRITTLVDGLTEKLKKNDYRIQSLIQAIVASEPFNTK